MNDTRPMQKRYRAMIGEVCNVYVLNPDEVHHMLKVWYKKKTTSNMSYDERIEYIDNIHYFFAVVFDMYFDTDRYKNEHISYTFLFGSETLDKPDNYTLLF